MDLPHSDACFVQAYPAETAEAFCDGHNAAFAFFGKVPQRSAISAGSGSI
jgi:transposase